MGVNMGDEDNLEHRPRRVGKELNTYRHGDLFAATPPRVANTMLMSMAVVGEIGFERGRAREGTKLDCIDARSALLC